MARIRTVKPEFWTDSLMVQLPPLARLLYVAIWTASDDHGCFRDEPERLAMEVMPREDFIEIDDLLQLLIATDRISMRLDEEGSTYLQVERWSDHQKIDKPSKSRIIREGSRKLAISPAVRRAVAEKYGCLPGAQVEASCYYCDSPGGVHWWTLSSGKASAWVVFPGLELDHLISEASGGETSKENIVLACRRCNRSKGAKHWIEALCLSNGIEPSRILARTIEGSGRDLERKGKERKREAQRADGAPTPSFDNETNLNFEGPPDEIPLGLDLTAWERWRSYRISTRKPLKPVSLPAAQRQLAAFGSDQAAVVEQSIANGWKGLFALKSNGNGHGEKPKEAGSANGLRCLNP